MKFASTILAIVGLFTTVVSALPKVLDTRSDMPHPIGVMTFKGTVGGHQVNLNGTVQEMNAKLTHMFPGFNTNALVTAPAHKERAADNKEPPPICWPVPGQSWSFCDAATIQDGVRYLDNFKGLCNVGKNSCVRVSCSYNAAIYLCNDNNYEIEPNCGYIGSYASDIISKCAFYNPIGEGYVCGQLFDTDHYNVIVREDKC